jgi:hypothetical protein
MLQRLNLTARIPGGALGSPGGAKITEMSMQAAILSPEMWIYGCTITPNYLK